MIKIKRISDKTVKGIVATADLDPRPWRGRKLFFRDDINLFLVAKKRSGKTSCIYRILKEVAGRDTNIIVFSATAERDNAYITMKKYFEGKNINFTTNTSLYDDEGKNQLEEILNNIMEEERKRNEAEDDEEIKQQMKQSKLEKETRKIMFGYGSDNESESKKKKKQKYKSVDYIFVFDDLSSELKDKSISRLLKSNRHYNCMTISSSQYMNDLDPQSRKQIDCWILYGGHREDKLSVLFNDADLSIDFQLFMKLYKYATKEKYHFLYIDTRNDTFRKDFTHQIIINENEDI